MMDLTQREADFRRHLSPDLSSAETEAAATDWRMRQPEARPLNEAIIAGQLTIAIEALEKVRTAAEYLDATATMGYVWEILLLARLVRGAYDSRGAVGDRVQVGVSGRRVDGGEIL